MNVKPPLIIWLKNINYLSNNNNDKIIFYFY